MHPRDDRRTAITLGRFHDVVRSAEMMAYGRVAATHPRELLAERITLFVRTFDREKAWPTEGPYSDAVLRKRAVEVADVLADQGRRMRLVK